MSAQSIFPLSVFNVRDFGANGKKEQNAQAAIQQTIDACAAAGGGMVYLPPGEYTTGTLIFRSHVRFFIEAGATVFSSKNPDDFTRRGLFYAEDVENISLEGRGTVDGQGEYVYRETDMRDWYIYPNELQARAVGWPLSRSFPTPESVGHLVLFVRATDVRISGLSFLRSPSWTMHLWGCERLYIDSVYIRTSLPDGVWADGIDPDGCKDVHINNCTIETGDDALVFYSSNIYGPARPCENITVTNCRLSSASSGLKFCDGNQNAIRNVTIQNCVINTSNRGIAFMLFDGGVLENIIISNVTIQTQRYEWFWWGDGDPIHFRLIQRSEIDANVDKSKEPPVGVMRNIILRDVLAKGSGECLIHGHKDSPLENVTFDNVRLELAFEPDAAPRRFEQALRLENGRNIRFRNCEVVWSEPNNPEWQSALTVDNVQGLVLDGFSARQAPGNDQFPAVSLNDVDGVRILNCQAQPGTSSFLQVSGQTSHGISLLNNDFSQAQAAVKIGPEVPSGAVTL
jgi:hypothetical protein